MTLNKHYIIGCFIIQTWNFESIPVINKHSVYIFKNEDCLSVLSFGAIFIYEIEYFAIGWR